MRIIPTNTYLFKCKLDGFEVCLNSEFKCNGYIACDDLEDEYHFVVTCVKFYDLRIKYLPKHLYTNPSMYKFLNFVNTENKSQLRKLGLFLHHAFIKYTNDEVLN